MATYKKLESFKSNFYPPEVRNLDKAKDYVNKVFKTAVDLTKDAGKKIAKEARFMGRYCKERPVETALTLGGIVIGSYTTSHIASALSDPDFFIDLKHLRQPRGSTIIPYSNPRRYSSQEPSLTKSDPLYLASWLSLGLTAADIAAALVLEPYRYLKWRRCQT